MNISELKTLLKQRQSLSRTAREVGISESYFNGVLNGKVKLPIKQIGRFALATNIHPSGLTFLMSEEDQESYNKIIEAQSIK